MNEIAASQNAAEINRDVRRGPEGIASDGFMPRDVPGDSDGNTGDGGNHEHARPKVGISRIRRGSLRAGGTRLRNGWDRPRICGRVLHDANSYVIGGCNRRAQKVSDSCRILNFDRQDGELFRFFSSGRIDEVPGVS